MRHQDETTFTEISTLVQEVIFRPGEENALLGTQERCIDMVLELVDPRNEQVLQVLRGLKGKTHAKQMDLLTKTGALAVINHGDMWANNILLGNNSVKLIDFQIMRFTSLAADLNYFLYVNLDPNFRIEHKDEFLRYYLDELLANIKEWELPVEKLLTMEWLQNEMRKYALFGFICGLWVLPVFYHTLEMVEKSEDGFKKHTSETVESLIANMGADQKDRLIRLIYSYASNSQL